MAIGRDRAAYACTRVAVQDHAPPAHRRRGAAALGWLTVIEADSGPAALAVLAAAPHVDLPLPDIVMPGGMTGRQLAEAVRKLRPELGAAA